MSNAHIPDGYGTVTPYLIVDSPEAVIDFLTGTFGGEVTERMETPDGRVRHAEVRVGTSMLMMGPAREDWSAMPIMLYLYVEDCDADYAKALENGATSHQEPADMPYGDRTAAVKGPCGNYWYLATRKESLTSEEIAERVQAADNA